MMKLKEIKAKSEDSGSKARQYLDGLLRVPFKIYKREPVLNIMYNIKTKFKHICKTHNSDDILQGILVKENYTSIEVFKYVKKISSNLGLSITDEINSIDILKKKTSKL